MQSVTNPTKRRGDFTVKQVRVFLAASQCSTFRQAASMVCLSHAAFANAILELEASLGEELFVRTRHGNQLSCAGVAFLPDALRLMDCYSTALASLGKWRDAQQCHFVLAGNNSIMPTVLRDLLDRFRANFETVSFEYEECTSQRVIESVRQGLANCGLCSVFAARPELHCTPLLEAPLGILCHPAYQLPESFSALHDLNGLSLLRFSDDSDVTQLLRLHPVSFDAYHGAPIVCNSLPAAYAMLQGGYVAAITSGIGATHVQAQGLRFIPLPDLLPKQTVNLVCKRDQPLNVHQIFMKRLTTSCAREAQWHPSVKVIPDHEL